MRDLPDYLVDAVVTDPPAGVPIPGKEWDDFRRSRNAADAGRDNQFGRTSARGPEYGRSSRSEFVGFLTPILAECMRLTKPGGRLLCWCNTRTSHWTGSAIEDAGWEVEDVLTHLFLTGFPKSKTRLKPASELWYIARKPSRYVVPLDIDACRVDGRWPPNVCLSHDCGDVCDEDCPVRELSDQMAGKVSVPSFFYAPKATRADRGDGNTHPTVKCHPLMRWLVRLVARPGQSVLDPFMGSGSTGKACEAEGVDFLGIEQSADYAEMAGRRILTRREDEES